LTVVGSALVAITLSTIAILALCIGDPKRRRAAGDRSEMSPRGRRLLVVAACMPGVACLLLGEAAAFMLWFGGSALSGWSVASCFAARGSRQSG
jgi:hypothetical protein